jgi:alpha-galactosidase
MHSQLTAQTIPAPATRWDAGAPAIHGPCIYGASPGKEFLYLAPTVGERPLRFTAAGLPTGLTIGKTDGRITGRATVPGDYRVLLEASNRHGTAERELTIRIGEDALALTPPMGWNSWNCFRSAIDAEKIERIAAGMVSSGLAAYGYSYVNLDSGWQSKQRGGPFHSIVPHEGFPDMGAVCDHIHALGLKMGIYSGPYVVPWGTQGCGSTSGRIDTRFPGRFDHPNKYIGLEKHEVEDAAQWADWGIDYFKYDWAHTDMVLAERMGRALRQSPRDIVYSITTNVQFADADKVGDICHLWRANADTHPTWESVLKNGFGNERWNPYIGPGHWFDLDMTALLPRDGQCLTPAEQVACFTCWAIRPSPLLIDCVPDELDDFALSLLCNEEVIAVNQDVLGLPALPVLRQENWEVQLKPLADGDYAIGVFNLGEETGISPEVKLSWLGIEGGVKLRDLWTKQDLAGRRDTLAVPVEGHSAKLFRAVL